MGRPDILSLVVSARAYESGSVMSSSCRFYLPLKVVALHLRLQGSRLGLLFATHHSAPLTPDVRRTLPRAEGVGRETIVSTKVVFPSSCPLRFSPTDVMPTKFDFGRCPKSTIHRIRE